MFNYKYTNLLHFHQIKPFLLSFFLNHMKMCVYLWRIYYNFFVMTTVSLTYNEKNKIARKTMDYLLSLGLFKVVDPVSPSRRTTLKAIEDARNGKGLTRCESFEDYLKAVSE